MWSEGKPLTEKLALFMGAGQERRGAPDGRVRPDRAAALPSWYEWEIGDGSEFKSLWWNHPQHTSLPCSFSQPRVDLIDGETSQGFELLA